MILVIVIWSLNSLISSVVSVNFVVTAPQLCRVGKDCKVALNILQSRFQAASWSLKVYSENPDSPHVPFGEHKQLSTSQQSYVMSISVPIDIEPGNAYMLESTVTDIQGGTTVEKKSIAMDSVRFAPLIQTDKAVYRPSEKVKFRVLCIRPDTSELTPCGSCKLNVSIHAPVKNIMVEQWLNADFTKGVFTQEFELADSVLTEDWKIEANLCDRSQYEKKFKVQQHRIPKFYLKLDAPEYYLINSGGFQIKITAESTYGALVRGKMNMKVVYEEVNGEPSAIIKTDELFSGQFTLDVKDDDLVKWKGDRFNTMRVLTVNVEVKKNLSEITEKETINIPIHVEGRVVKFLDQSPKVFISGTKYNGALKVLFLDGKTNNNWNNLKLNFMERGGKIWSEAVYNAQNVNSDGVLEFALDVPKNFVQTSAILSAQWKPKGSPGIAGFVFLGRFQTTTSKIVQVTAPSTSFKCGSLAQVDVNIPEGGQEKIVYIFVCRGVIVNTGIKETILGKVSITESLSREHMPSCTIIILVEAENNELVANAIEVEVLCELSNPIHVTFKNPNEQAINRLEQPRDQHVRVCVSAGIESYIGLLGVDSRFQKLDNDITTDKFKDILKNFGLISGVRKQPAATDSYQVLHTAGVMVLTDGNLYQSVSPRATMEEITDSSTEMFRIQKFFPKTWIWLDIESIGASEKCLKVKVPDTKAKFAVTAFAMSKTSGLGITTSSKEIEVFKPFSISLMNPTSIRKGEQFLMRVLLQSSMSSTQQPTVTLEKSNDFFVSYAKRGVDIGNVVPESKQIQITVKIAMGQTVELPIWVFPQKIGELTFEVAARLNHEDYMASSTVTVKPEGQSVLEVESALLHLPDDAVDQSGGSHTFDNLNIPNDAISGSSDMSVYVSGDLMRASVDELQKLLELPTGSGEQNIFTMLPYVFILQYLDATTIPAPTDSFRSAAMQEIRHCYQRQLSYRSKDMSFKFFSEDRLRRGPGSIWLTAFVLKSFQQASQFVDIDTVMMSYSLNWLKKQQMINDGSFQETPGTSVQHPQTMDKTALTAFVLTSLLLNRNLFDIDDQISRATVYLVKQIEKTNDVYSLALLTYALHLANNENKDKAFTKILALATASDNELFLSTRRTTIRLIRSSPEKSLSTDVEANSYMLMTCVMRLDADAIKIGNWLVRQRNGRGGFYSTQDTAVGLQALAQLSSTFFKERPSLDVSIQAFSGMAPVGSHDFTIPGDKRLRVQSKLFPKSTNKIKVSVTGNGLAVVSVVRSYTSDRVRDSVIESTVTVTAATSFKYSLNVCYSSTQATGMCVSEVEAISGFSASDQETESIINRRLNPNIKRVEIHKDRVIVYHNEITSTETCFAVTFKRTSMVVNSKKASVKVYSYYRPELSSIHFYIPSPVQVASKETFSVGLMPHFNTTNALKEAQVTPIKVPYVFLVPRVCRVKVACTVGLHLSQPLPVMSKWQVSLYKANDIYFTDPIAQSVETTLSVGQTIVASVLNVPSGEQFTQGVASFTLVGAGVSMKDATIVGIETKHLAAIIQSDKAVYKPTQVVRFRVVCVKPDTDELKPCAASCKINVTILDPKGNRVKKLISKSMTIGVFNGEVELSDNIPKGEWKIMATLCDQTRTEKSITVDEQIEPFFDVKLVLQPFYIVGSGNLRVTVSATYPYGEEVTGSLKMVARFHSLSIALASPIQKSNSFTGTSFFTLTDDELVTWAGGKQALDNKQVILTAEVAEERTNRVVGARTVVRLYTSKIRVQFSDLSPNVYKRGPTYIGYLKVSLPDNEPVDEPWDSLKLFTRSVYKPNTPQSEIDDFSSGDVIEDGLIKFTIQTDALSGPVVIEAQINGLRVSKRLQEFESKSTKSGFIHISNNKKDITCNEHVTFDVTLSETSKQLITYALACRGRINEFSQDMASGGSYRIYYKIASLYAPSCKLLVFADLKGTDEIVADSLEFSVSCNTNPVSVQYKDERDQNLLVAQALGQTIKACVSTEPHSFVGLSVVGGLLAIGSKVGAAYKEIEDKLKLYHRNIINSGESSTSDKIIKDTQTVFEDVGLSAKSDKHIHKSILGNDNSVPAYNVPRNDLDKDQDGKSFSDTWIWISGTTDDSGSLCQPADLPNSAKSWMASAIAVSASHGLGAQGNTAKLAVNRPFYVSLDFPPVTKRGEEFELKIIIYNYIGSVQTTTVVLEKSDSFFVRHGTATDVIDSLEPKSKRVTAQIDAVTGQGNVVKVWIVPRVLGDVTLRVGAQTAFKTGGIEEVFSVKPEGETISTPKSVLIHLSSKSATSTTFDGLNIPSKAVGDSAKIELTVSGDLMAAPIEGLDNLLTIPIGCGEQNMIKMVPNILVLRYLKTIKSDQRAFSKRATRNLELGYQRQLVYIRNDHSFSAFGEDDKRGSLWLTAFVMRSFSQAADFIFIDNEMLENAMKWMLMQREDDGGFIDPGYVVHSEMQGGLGKDKTALTAFVLIALHENKNIMTDLVQPITRKTADFLAAQLTNLRDTYVTALVTYALHLVDHSQKDEAFRKMESKANKANSEIYWGEDTAASGGSQDQTLSPHPRDIETTSYALLTYVLRKSTEAIKIGKWLTRQSNGMGGFISTQDTVVGLQAISELASIIQISDPSLILTAQYRDGDETIGSHTFDTIVRGNRFNLQMTDVPIRANQIALSGTGFGSVPVSVVVSYNTQENSYSSVRLTVDVAKDTDYEYSIIVCHWSTSSTKAGMGVTEIQPITGFSASQSEVEKALEGVPNVKRIVTESDRVVLYHDEIVIGSTTCLTIPFKRTTMVTHPQKAEVKVYNYYQPSQLARIFYLPSKAAAMKSSPVDVITEPESSTLPPKKKNPTTPKRADSIQSASKVLRPSAYLAVVPCGLLVLELAAFFKD